MTSDNQRVLIIGGGIGGLTAAVALQQAGINATIFERRESMEQAATGAGVHLWSNALVALHRIGMAEEVAQMGTPVHLHRYVTWRGRSLGQLRVQALSAAVGAPTTGVSRERLHTALRDRLAPESIEYDKECVGFEQNTSRALVRFADGSQAQGSLIIGADGIGSVIRRQLHGDIEARYSGMTAWRAICDYDDSRMPPGEMVIYWGRGARILHYRVSDGRLYWLALVKAPQRSADIVGERQKAVQEIFRGWPAQVQGMLAATEESQILRTDIRDRDPLKNWGRGRVTLLGDAAHPMTPDMAQGAGQAIEDAVSLSGSLRRHGAEDQALRDYERRRMTRGNDLVSTSRAVARMGVMSSAVLCAVRDRIILPTVYATQGFGPARKNLTAVL